MLFDNLRQHHITLEIANELVAEGGGYRSTGSDPQFILRSSRRRLPRRWVVISYLVESADTALAPVLYIDNGSGFSEQRTVALPWGNGRVETIVRLPDRVRRLRLDPLAKPGTFSLREMRIYQTSRVELVWRLVRDTLLPGPLSWKRLGQLGQAGLTLWKRHGLRGLLARVKALNQTADGAALLGGVRERLAALAQSSRDTAASSYRSWVGLYDTLTDSDRQAIRAQIDTLPQRPLISVVMPVYNTPEHWLRRALESVLDQLYPHWELCIADDASTEPRVRRVLESYRDPRIKILFREHNGHIAAASNSALELASGEWTVLLDHDDELAEHALYLIAETIHEHPQAGLIYSDEDKIDEQGNRYEPHFKSDWNPDLFLSQNILCHLGAYRTDLLRAAGGFREGFDGSQDYDLALRIVEQLEDNQVHHIPHVLYHWRAIGGSVAHREDAKDYAYEAARRAIQEHLERQWIPARVIAGFNSYFHRVVYDLPDPPPKVSVIIPTRDRCELLRTAVTSILHRTDYPDLELIIVDNRSEQPETLAYFKELEGIPAVRVLRHDAPFNYSAINNRAVREARGQVLALVNNDIEVIAPEWLREMVSHALRPVVGAVGARLLYPDGSLQHAGILLGLGGTAGHAHQGMPRDASGYFGRARLIQNFSAVTAACMVLRREVFEAVGGFDEEHLAVAFNDIDLCLRIREQGYRIVWTPYAELYHHESASLGLPDTPQRQARYLEEVGYLKARWSSVLAAPPEYNPNLTLAGGDFSLAFPPRARKPWR